MKLGSLEGHDPGITGPLLMTDSFSSSLIWVYPPERYSKDHADLSSLFYFSFTGDAVNLVYIGFLHELLPQDQLTLDCRTFCLNSKARRIIHLTG